jgi:hypothetical protein
MADQGTSQGGAAERGASGMDDDKQKQAPSQGGQAAPDETRSFSDDGESAGSDGQGGTSFYADNPAEAGEAGEGEGEESKDEQDDSEDGRGEGSRGQEDRGQEAQQDR